MSDRRKGFTLVELSVVLVIIGLLISGILVAQSMISAAKVTAQVKQFQQFDIATSNFKQQFKTLPGDDNVIGATYGNNNGLLESIACCWNRPYMHPGAEFTNFWNHLTLSGTLQDGHVYAVTWNAISPGINVATAQLNGAGILAYGIPATSLSYYDIASSWVYGGDYQAGSSTKPTDLAALDAKMDDGNGSTGKVVARITNTNYFNAAVTTDTNCMNVSGIYNTSNTSLSCLPRIEMFSQTGGAY